MPRYRVGASGYNYAEWKGGFYPEKIAGVTAPYGYFRLRDEGYAREDLRRWADAIKAGAKACSDVFVYFKHEEKGKGPELARLMADALAAGTDD